MKKLLLFILTLLCSLNSYSQKDSTEVDSTSNIPTIMSLADDRAKKLLPQYAPLSPNAAAQQKLGDYQVNLSTGIPSIPIHIYTIKEGSLAVPITLNFHTGGFKMNEQASWVGLGVALDIGASLNRTVQGLKDDNDGGSYLTNPVTVSRDFCNNTTDFNYGQSVVLNQTDTQPDIFSYNLSSGSSSKNGRFLLGQNGGSHFRIPDYPIQIAYAGSPAISSFDLVNDDGVAYKFGGTSAALESQTVVSGFTTQSYTSSWLISQVRSPDSDDIINYSYQGGGSQYFSEKQWVSTMILNAVPQSGGHYENSQNSLPTYTNVSTSISQANPYKITFSNGEVEFIQSAVGERLDLPNSHFLKQINIYNYENSVKTLIKVVKFTYSYFTHNGINKRLKLDKVSFEDALGIVTEPYIPEYWTNTLSWDDELDNEKKDFFGNFNGKPNTHLIPVGSYQGIPIVGGAADRSTVDTYMKEGVIKRLNFPSGGYTEFDFETNKYNDGTSDLFAGGLRVKSIKSVTGTSGFIKRYEYESLAGVGIGRLTTNWSPTNATVPSLQILSYSDAGGTNVAQATQASFTQSGGAVDLNTFDSAPVYYTTVTEYFEDASDPIKNGKNVYTFDFRQDLIVNAIDYSSRDVQPWKRGNLLSKTVYDASGNIVENQTNSYQELNINTRTAGAFVKTSNIFEGSVVRSTNPCPTTFLQSAIGFSGSFPEMIYASVNYHTGINLLSGSSTTTDNVSTNKTITYNNKLFIAQTQSDDSKTGDFLTEIFKYPFDAVFASDPIAQELIARNQLNPILENETQETISGLTSTIYKDKTVYDTFAGNNARGLTDNVLPKEIWIAPTGGTLEKRVEYVAYDADGNPLEYKQDEVSTSMVWGYNNSLLIGMVKNATAGQVSTAISSTGLNAADFSVTNLSNAQITTLGNFRNGLPNTQVSWFTHIPNVGMSNGFSPNGLKTSYEYDSFQRFSAAKDHEGNLLTTNFYKVSPTENYIRSAILRMATSNPLDALSFNNAKISYQLFDELGRQTQMLGYGQTPDFKTILGTEITYDRWGRPIQNILPVSSGVLSSSTIMNGKALAQSFYNDTAPIDSTIYEASPLNRTKASFGVGQAWRANNKNTQIFYESAGTDVRYYSVNNANSVILNGFYPAQSLFKKRIIDEQGHTSVETTDKRGRLIQKQVQKDNSGNWLTTYYCYDGMGRIRAILPPMVYNLNQTIAATDQAHGDFVFAFEYDSRGRLIREDIPGAEERYSVYDKRDRLVMQKDALQSETGKWSFWKYDAFDREVMRGETGNIGFNQSYWASLFASHSPINETWLGAGGYDAQSFPSAVSAGFNEVQMYTFYDQYDFVSALNTNFAFDAGNAYHAQYSNATGLLTGSVKYNLADHNQYFMTALYYDSKNRPIQSFETHALSPTLPNRQDFEYNFAGEVVNSRQWVLSSGLADLTITSQSTYNHIGLQTNFFHGINDTPVEIYRFTFDPINRLMQKKIMPNGTYLSGGIQDYIFRSTPPASALSEEAKKAINLLPGTYIGNSEIPYSATINPNGGGGTTINGLQTIDYAHHIRGWLKGINLDVSGNTVPNAIQGDLFAYQLEYETAGHFDGNIGSQKWHDGQNQRTYNYTYDSSKRLKTAAYVGVGAETYDLPNINYDDNGNILNLQRNGKLGENSFGLMDNLTYGYSGNRLNSVLDAVETNNEVDFVPRGNNTYTYYSNGALKSDANEQIADIVYNTYLNQPSEVFLTDGRKIKHYYDGDGALFKTEYFNAENSVIETYHYIDGIIYKNGAFYQIGIPDGRVVFSDGTWQYEFDYKDHLGNTRASFKADGNTLVQTAKTDFDPFGVILKSSQANSIMNFFEYQDKLSEKVFGLNRINLGARNYNPTIGRMDNIDGMAGKFSSHSLYNYVLNNPLNVIDPDGNESRDIWGNTTFNGFVGDDGSGNYVGTTTGGGEGDDKDKGKKKEEEKKTSREKALEVKGKGFWEFMNFAFSTDGLSFLIDEIYKVEGSGNLAENAHPVEKVNEITQNFALAQVVGVIGKNFSLIKDSQLKKSGLDAHEIKKSWLGKNAKISQFDLYKDTKTNEILILKKGGKGDPINTNIKMK